MSEAFNQLFDHILGWQKRDKVTLVFDEDFCPFVNHFTEAGNERSADIFYLFVPQAVQKRIISEYHKFPVELSARIRNVLLSSDIIVNVLNGSIEMQPFRKAIVTESRGNRSAKLAHIPGLSREILELLTISPFEKISHNCELLAWAIGQSTEIRIETFDRNGNIYDLLIQKLRWNDLFPPQISSGVIEKGSWGNVPPGETFICPQARNVTGKVCINGSLQGKVLAPEDEFVLNFTAGVMDDIATSSDEIRKHFDQERESAIRVNDDNWNRFAEFGIGANPAIRSLSGNMLFDEKMANTIHIAIGDNSVFGGNVSSKIHEDMVIKEVNVYFDKWRIINKGVVDYDTLLVWKKQSDIFDDVEIESKYVSNIKRDSIKVVEGKVYRCIEMSRRTTCVFIAEGALAQAVVNIAQCIHNGRTYKVDDLSGLVPNEVDLKNVIKLMVNYDLLTLD